MSITASSTPFRTTLDTLLRKEAKPADKYGHQPRLYALTRLVGKGTEYDDDVVFAAAYLHDIGVFIGHRPEAPDQLRQWNHVQYALETVPDMLMGANFPEDKIPAVLAAIATHQPHDKPESIEAIVLRDADILEQLGAIGILRAVAKTGRDTRYETFTPIIAFLSRSLEELPAHIRLDTTRALAAPRLALLRAFLAGVEAEAQGCLF
ncbi:HD domain-containing protein [Acidipila sp. EB88]|uniref:HD domain-containing protein n=1 Tax=Acidipila sp. EB88 TaxID=2305226 RepID=UPI000F5EF87E|nr:HD domain-containing protein [Acidipila sp. EB88]RRA49492.1 HD domain-containing protein [Acidipila sp. EB88]